MAFEKSNVGGGMAHDIGTAYAFTEYSSFASEINLTASSVSPGRKMCRAIMVTSAGSNTLQVRKADGNTQSIDCTNLVGVLLPIQAKAITTATNVAKLVVFW